MGKASREKGKRGEREWANAIRGAFPEATVSRSTQADQAHEPDVMVRGAGAVVDRIWWECRYAESMSPADRLAKLEQAELDSAAREGAIPIAITRKTGARSTVATLRLGSFEALHGDVRVPFALQAIVVELDADVLLEALREITAADAARRLHVEPEASGAAG